MVGRILFFLFLFSMGCGVSKKHLETECDEANKAWDACRERLSGAMGLSAEESKSIQEDMEMYQECGQEKKAFEEDCSEDFMEFFDCAEMLIDENDCATDADIEDLWAEIATLCGDPEECWSKEE